ncbi:multiprotein-bridging factor 1 family protein [Micromonospora sp. NPDC050187]|uniref:multiprotein-bridging factor 1 family protein n=1 Tax=Micromonospora sp. NPDC050187 TaxID=3364277 RepID=UPI0037A64122
MPVRSRAVVDPRFAAELARLRRERGLSLRGLARSVFYGKSYLHDLETGRTRPTGEVARYLGDALWAGGTLAAMVVDTPAVTTRDDDQRIAYVISHPARLDAPAVRLLADVLAHQRGRCVGDGVVGGAAVAHGAGSRGARSGAARVRAARRGGGVDPVRRLAACRSP